MNGRNVAKKLEECFSPGACPVGGLSNLPSKSPTKRMYIQAHKEWKNERIKSRYGCTYHDGKFGLRQEAKQKNLPMSTKIRFLV